MPARYCQVASNKDSFERYYDYEQIRIAVFNETLVETGVGIYLTSVQMQKTTWPN